MGVNVTSGVHFSVKILQPPQVRVHFIINGDCCITIPYILINFVQVNRSKNTLQVGAKLALIERSYLEHERDNLEWFSR